MSTLKSLKTAVYLLLTDRKKFKFVLDYKLNQHKNRHIVPQDQRTVSQSIESVLQLIQAKKYSKIIVCSDSAFYSGLNQPQWLWTSIQSRDLPQAKLLDQVSLKDCDAILVGGKDVKTAYIHALKLLKKKNIVKPVLWAGDAFEFGGSTVPLITELKDADIYLFNHYGEFFQNKDPLLVKTRLQDQSTLIEKFFILEPNESFHLNLRTLLPKQNGNAVLEVSTTHPVLTRKRHRRWRLWADLQWKDSLTSLHGAHDYGPAELNSAFMATDLIESGKIIVTLANYELDMKPNEAVVTKMLDHQITTVNRDPKLLVDQITFDHPNAKEKPSYAGFRYWGYGDNFWHFFEEKGFQGSNHPVIMSNHNSTQPIELRSSAKLDAPLAWVEKMRKDGFMVFPHAIPVLPENDVHEFGFSFEWANFPVNHFIAHVFNSDGKKIGNFPFVKEKATHAFTSDILRNFPQKSEANLIVIEADTTTQPVDPKTLYMAGDLAIRNKKTQDRDLTEFQSCWRNVGVLFPDFPHWIHPSKAVIGRSNLVGRVSHTPDWKSAFVLVNGSGNLNYQTQARCQISIFTPNGKSQVAEVVFPPFGSKVIWAHDLFPNLSQFLNEGYGSCIISSLDADFNAQIFTSTSKGSVALQHLWGY